MCDKQPDHVDDERRDVLKGVTGLAAAGLLGGFGSSTAAATTTDWEQFAGLDHTPLGSAEPFVEDGSLVVSNLDDTGESGVNVALGEAQGVTIDTTLDWSDPYESFREFRSTGIVDGASDQPLGMLRSRRVDSPDGFALTPDFGGIGADTHTWEVYDQGELVGRQEEVADAASYIPDREPNVEAVVIIIWTDTGPIIIIVIVGSSGPVVGPRMNDYVGNEIHLVPETPEVTPDAVTDLDVVAAGRDQFTIDDESLYAAGNPNNRRGNATLEGFDAGRTLGVSNVGSAGGDGVGVELDGGKQFRTELDGMDLSPTESSAQFDLTGTFDGTADSPLGHASLTNVGDALEIEADFRDVGADGVRAAVFDNGEKVGETTVEPGVIGSVADPTLVGWCGSDGDDVIIIIIIIIIPEPLPHEFSDGSEFVGDELRLSPTEVSGEITELSEYGIEGANVDSFGVLGDR
jgi:hypothetical protein